MKQERAWRVAISLDQALAKTQAEQRELGPVQKKGPEPEAEEHGTHSCTLAPSIELGLLVHINEINRGLKTSHSIPDCHTRSEYRSDQDSSPVLIDTAKWSGLIST
jgi:hypothetical protein